MKENHRYLIQTKTGTGIEEVVCIEITENAYKLGFMMDGFVNWISKENFDHTYSILDKLGEYIEPDSDPGDDPDLKIGVN